MENMGVLTFFGLIVFLFYCNYTAEVEVSICEYNGLTQYINKTPPPRHLNVGECKIVKMTNGEYYEIMKLMKEGRRK